MKIAFDGVELGRGMAIRGLDDRALAGRAGVSPDPISAARHGREVTLASATRISRALANSPIDETLDLLVPRP